jgi:triacylglycerol lipase
VLWSAWARGTPEAFTVPPRVDIVRRDGRGWPSDRSGRSRMPAEVCEMRRPPVRPVLAIVVAVVAAAVVAALASARHSSDPSRPVARRPPAAAQLRCATARHPYPVVLVPGTFEATSWSAIADGLAARGYCVQVFQYASAGTGSIARSAQELGRFVDRVLARTHAARVSIVGHSEGGMTARYYVRFQGGAAKVEDLVALAPPNHGTTTPLVIPGAVLGCLACLQQAAGSNFLATLNAGDGTPAPVDYTVIETRYDLVVTPYQSAFLRGPANRITNVVLQRACPADPAGHLTITSDPVAVQWVQDALARNGPADPRFSPRC